MRYLALLAAFAGLVLSVLLALQQTWGWGLAGLFFLLGMVGLYDLAQPRHSLWRNFPIIGRIRWIAESLRPFLRAYIVESETEGRPFNHEERAMVYRRAKNVSSVEPFGSHLDIDKPPYEWLTHSIGAAHPPDQDFRITVGGPDCTQPYECSVLNISAMSFGSLGAHAIEALNRGAAMGGFFHNTGEGGVSRYHKAGGGDIVWQIGSGYFGCRLPGGGFDPEQFAKQAVDPQIKMIEIKLSQGAKPGHGGVLPGHKVTPEIAEARGITIGETCLSPAAHSAFSTPEDLLMFIARLREMSGGKPVGFKLCIGNRWEFLAIVKAMLDTGVKPDYIVVDGSEGGTGAAPAEFLDHVGAPLRDGLVFVRNALVGAGIRDDIKIGASGKLVSAFSMSAALALGADWINTGRGFMFSLGCIQSLHCHTNKCPTGIATQDASLQKGLVVADKARRVFQFHQNTMKALAEVVGAAGCLHPNELTPAHITRRITADLAKPADEVYPLLSDSELLFAPEDTHLAKDWARAQPHSFAPRQEEAPIK